MAKIKKAIDWEGDFLNIYDQIERKDLSPSAIEHKWAPFGVKKEGTAVNAELLNDFQKNGIYGTLNTVKEIINSIERYIIKDFYGIEEFGVFEELKLKIKISDANNEDNPKLVLNGIEYSMIYSTETSFVNIKKGQLEKNKIYNLIFNGVAFIVESSSLKATADSSGLMSLSDVRKEIANLSGASYSGIFGSELKNIIAGNSYLYIDANGKGNVYKAIRNNTNLTGFLIPTSADFANITNNYLYETVKGIGQIANWSNYGLYNDSNYEIIKANSNNEFQVRVKEWGLYMLSAKAYVHMNANSNVTLTVYNDGNMASISRNGSLSAGQEMLSLPLISNGVEANKTIRFVVSGQIAVGSEWGYYITRLV